MINKLILYWNINVRIILSYYMFKYLISDDAVSKFCSMYKINNQSPLYDCYYKSLRNDHA